MARSRKKTYSASLSWHRLTTFLSLTSELHHWYRVADPVLQSRHQKEDKYQVNAFQRLSTLKTNKFITACFSVCSICKCSFSESALCTPSHTSRAEPDKRSLSKTSKHISSKIRSEMEHHHAEYVAQKSNTTESFVKCRQNPIVVEWDRVKQIKPNSWCQIKTGRKPDVV